MFPSIDHPPPPILVIKMDNVKVKLNLRHFFLFIKINHDYY